MEYVSITIAVFSILLSLYAVRLGRINRGYDLLFKYYTDLRLKDPQEASTIEDIVHPEDDELTEDEEFIRSINSFRKSENREAKFNLLCYAVIKRQIPFEEFFTLFAPYLQGRLEFWPKFSTHRIGNYPYTAKIIDKCLKKGLLPVKDNKKYLHERKGILRYWKEGREAFSSMQDRIMRKK